MSHICRPPYPLDTPASREAAAFLRDALAAGDQPALQTLATAMATAPYLNQLCRQHTPLIKPLLAEEADRVMTETHAQFAAAMQEATSDEAVMSAIRQLRHAVNLVVAVTDMTDSHPENAGDTGDTGDAENRLVAQHLHWLSATADTACQHLAEWLLASSPLRDSPSRWCILALGKLGARELNFSSDIDLLVLYDPSTSDQTGDSDQIAQQYITLTRRSLKLMGQTTKHGIGWRVDLRLRPNPSVTPVAISLTSALHYYESVARTWERAAFIRARPVAGDMTLGEGFLADIAPFVWRRYLDYAVIDDMRMMWQREPIPSGLLGYDVKKGQGGIRAIEFFVHIQQLIAGGREKDLRLPSTAPALAQLAEKKWITGEEARTLTEYYYALRRLEHRIQMVADAHVHALPRQPEDMTALAKLCGYDDSAGLVAAIEKVIAGVAANSASVGIRLGVAQSDTTSKTPHIPLGLMLDQDYTAHKNDGMHRALIELGFDDPASIIPICRKWLCGEVAATQSQRAREILTRILPDILKELSRAAQPTQAFHAFARLVEALPFGVQLFSLLESNPAIANIMSAILIASPRLTAEISAHPQLADELLYDEFWQPFDADAAALTATLTEAIATAPSYEHCLDTFRRRIRRWRFRVSVHLVTARIDCPTAAKHLTAIADAALCCAVAIAHKRIAETHGTLPDAAMLVVALGRLGAGEMTAASDLDLVFVHDVRAGAGEIKSDGTKPLPPAPYFTRIAQQIINVLTAATSEGSAYQVDMRLRPSGKAGPVTLSLASFLHYHRHSAWVWEHMALIRARVITGINHRGLEAAFEAGRAEVLGVGRAASEVLPAVAEMRRRIAAHKPPQSPRDVRLLDGGLLDFDFFAQSQQLLYPLVAEAGESGEAGEAAKARRVASGVEAIAGLMRQGVVRASDGEALLRAARTLMDIDHLLRLTMLDPHAQEASATVPQPLREAFGVATIGELDAVIAECCGVMRGVTARVK